MLFIPGSGRLMLNRYVVNIVNISSCRFIDDIADAEDDHDIDLVVAHFKEVTAASRAGKSILNAPLVPLSWPIFSDTFRAECFLSNSTIALLHKGG